MYGKYFKVVLYSPHTCNFQKTDKFVADAYYITVTEGSITLGSESTTNFYYSTKSYVDVLINNRPNARSYTWAYGRSMLYLIIRGY